MSAKFGQFSDFYYKLSQYMYKSNVRLLLANIKVMYRRKSEYLYIPEK